MARAEARDSQHKNETCPSISCRTEPVCCCVCGSVETLPEPIGCGFDFEYETTLDTFRMVRCAGCGHVYLNPRPTPDELPLIYPPHYYSYHYEQEVHPLAHRVKTFLDERKIGFWLARSPTDRPRFLDVGCGDGRYLRALHRRGVPKDRLWGVELTPSVVERLRKDGYRALCGRIEEVDGLPERGFDLIVMLQVLEHVADPSACLARLASLLDAGGALVIETPNVESLDRRLFARRYWGGYHFPRHWNLFDETTLARLMKRHGLEPVSVRYLPAPSFWIYSLRHAVCYGWGKRRLSAWFNPFRNVPLQALFTSWDMTRAALGFRTSNMQMIARRRR